VRLGRRALLRRKRAVGVPVDLTGTVEEMGAEAFADYRQAIMDPETVRAMCEDYRAGLTVDREHDEIDRAAGRKLQCPTLVLWSENDDLFDLFGDPCAIWEAWSGRRTGRINQKRPSHGRGRPDRARGQTA
jgi:pimeloyl-ACP methyl ester carboxylesterase